MEGTKVLDNSTKVQSKGLFASEDSCFYLSPRERDQIQRAFIQGAVKSHSRALKEERKRLSIERKGYTTKQMAKEQQKRSENAVIEHKSIQWDFHDDKKPNPKYDPQEHMNEVDEHGQLQGFLTPDKTRLHLR